MTHGQQQASAVLSKHQSHVPSGILVFPGHQWPDSKDPVPNACVVGARVSEREHGLRPGKEQRIRVTKVCRHLLLDGRPRRVEQFLYAAAAHQLAHHPQWQSVMRVAVRGLEVLHKCLALRALGFPVEPTEPILMVATDRSPAMQQRFEELLPFCPAVRFF